jgi:pantoate--beta-alanine ligase
MADVPVFATVEEMRQRVRAWRAAGDRVALVPTMGALHAGHVSLTRLAREHADRAVVSIFVNPTQFAPNEDFSAYPRTFEADCMALGDAGVDAIFHPQPESVYPPGFATTVSLAGPAAAGLEDRFRPTHFAGVATVVAKLLIAAEPDVAVFGEKDFQQLAVIRRLVRDLGLPVEIVGAPTVREPDGLAMSSRNAYLSPAERQVALVLYRTLQEVARAIRDGIAISDALGAGRASLEAAGFALDYLALRDASSLGEIAGPQGALRLLVAARLGRTRLIDNIALDLPARAGEPG